MSRIKATMVTFTKTFYPRKDSIWVESDWPLDISITNILGDVVAFAAVFSYERSKQGGTVVDCINHNPLALGGRELE